jgi:hypothetical protein
MMNLTEALEAEEHDVFRGARMGGREAGVRIEYVNVRKIRRLTQREYININLNLSLDDRNHSSRPLQFPSLSFHIQPLCGEDVSF